MCNLNAQQPSPCNCIALQYTAPPGGPKQQQQQQQQQQHMPLHYGAAVMKL